MSKPTIEGQTFWVEIMDELADELLAELNIEDPLQTVLTKEESEFGYLGEATKGFARMLDSISPMTNVVAFAELGDNEVEKALVVPHQKTAMIRAS